MQRLSMKFLATLLIPAMPWMTIPVSAGDAPATLVGSIVQTENDSPLVGARLHAGDPRTDRIYSSAPADAEGSFVLADLPPATYSLAVQTEAGLYLVQTPLSLAPGTTQTVNLAVTPQPLNLAADDDSDDHPGMFSFKENPLTAALTFLGIVAILGLVIGGNSDPSKNPPVPPSPSGS